VHVGLVLPPDREALALLRPLIDRATMYEVTPETTWAPDELGGLHPNLYGRMFRQLARISGKPFVAHGITGARWPDALARDHAAFGFLWYTEHLGEVRLDDLEMILPLPFVPDAEAVVRWRARLDTMRAVVPIVGVENAVSYFTLSDPMDEPAFLHAILDPGWWLLDLHNLWTMSQNLRFDPEAWLARAPLDRVIEIHVSGGAESLPGWLPGGSALRLDSHDGPVPDAVWSLLWSVALRCPGLRAITLERREGTFSRSDVPLLVEEMEQIARCVASV